MKIIYNSSSKVSNNNTDLGSKEMLSCDLYFIVYTLSFKSDVGGILQS